MLREKLASTLSATRRSLETMAARDFEQLERHLGEFLSTSRETFQESLKDLYLRLIKKLKSDEALDDSDESLLRLLIVGDAEFYLKYENNFDDWVAELRRLMAEMGKLQASGEQEVRDVLHLRALAQDASRVASDIAFYLDQKERVQRFNERTTEALDQADRKFLAGIIYHKMNSAEF